MDPLSITTSVITLIGAANHVYQFLQTIKHADRGLQSLVREVNALNGYLRSIEKALEDCRGNPGALTNVDPALWKESKIALSDCQETLDELSSVFFRQPNKPSRSNTLFRRTKLAAELRSRAGDIASFREKVSMSNLSLQTLLQVINVSLSLRNNESHNTILKDLKELKDALKKSSQAATVSYSTLFLNEQDNRLVHHLKGLIREAQEFHTSASTTASTVVSSGETQPPPTECSDEESKSRIAYCLPSIKRHQIETYLSQHRQAARPGSSASSEELPETISDVPQQDSDISFEQPQGGSDNTFSAIFTSGFSKIAQRALQQLDLHKAEGLLREALKWHSTSGSDDSQHQRHLQTQLALCSLLQGNRQESQDLILHLVDSGTEKNSVAHQLLYALTLLQLHELDFEAARDNSKRLWEVLQNTPDSDVLKSNHAMRLLATSYQESGDSLLADAIEAELPDVKLSDPLPGMVDFLVECEELLNGIFGSQDCSEISSSLSVVGKMHNLPIAKQPSSLQLREQLSTEACHLILPDSLSDTDGGVDEVDQVALGNQPESKKRSWSNLRALFRPRLSRENYSIDLYPVQAGAQRSPSKLRKRMKISHATQNPSEPGPRSHMASLSSLSEPNEPKVISSNQRVSEDPEEQHGNSSETIDQIVGQPEDILTQEANDCQTSYENNPQLQRQFSFQAGVIDSVSTKRTHTPLPMIFEMPPDNQIYELMDTSPRAHHAHNRDRRPNIKHQPRRLLEISRLSRFDDNLKLGLSRNPVPFSDLDFPSNLFNENHQSEDGTGNIAVTSLKMENDIYQLLGWKTSQTPTMIEQIPDTIGRVPASTDSRPTIRPSITMESSSSGSDTDVLSDTDQVTPSTRQTSFCSSIDPSVEADGDGLGNAGKLQGHRADPEIRPQFGPAVARLCRYRSPRNHVFRRRLPASTAAGIRRLFHAHSSRGDSFDFGFNNAIYTGPSAVIGPFTDLDKTDSSAEIRARDLTADDILVPSGGLRSLTPSQLHLRTINGSLSAVMEGIVAWEGVNKSPNHNGNDTSCIRSPAAIQPRTQIDEFFETCASRSNTPSLIGTTAPGIVC